MSLDATSWAWKQQITPTQKLVLLSMADRANEEHRCWPSTARLEADTGLDRKTIYRCIAAMEEAGLLRVYKRSGLRNVYELVGVLGREARTEQTSPKTGTGTKIDTSPKNGPPPVPKTDRDQYQNWDTESLRESNKNHPVSARAGAPSTHAPQGGQQTDAQKQAAPDAEASQPDNGAAHGKKRKPKRPQPPKQAYGEYGNVLLTEQEHARLVQDYGPDEAAAAIAYLDLHLGARKGADPYKSHCLAMRKWVFLALDEQRRRKLGLPRLPRAAPECKQGKGQDFFARMAAAAEREGSERHGQTGF